uniref:Uncharacterized protein n=1 Tax=Candidatus Kentrum eta TaxID=2126337 RepID=A0A450V069_9GAMM|nr:MAG: hypothetical protein BECKH772A_GA0070896_1002113 [Candidatus Kentron sp. H]VFJ91611.1 MAG: hypothetical protein BECKH772B_GA0070898_1001913 [Candidatus Kentron sp. H]VFJ98197.1 MAG: hypothetical protein BECKH772C_GA0070978_1001913 [Candidatus Kentron sp. H]
MGLFRFIRPFRRTRIRRNRWRVGMNMAIGQPTTQWRDPWPKDRHVVTGFLPSLETTTGKIRRHEALMTCEVRSSKGAREGVMPPWRPARPREAGSVKAGGATGHPTLRFKRHALDFALHTSRSAAPYPPVMHGAPCFYSHHWGMRHRFGRIGYMGDPRRSVREPPTVECSLPEFHRAKTEFNRASPEFSPS